MKINAVGDGTEWKNKLLLLKVLNKQNCSIMGQMKKFCRSFLSIQAGLLGPKTISHYCPSKGEKCLFSFRTYSPVLIFSARDLLAHKKCLSPIQIIYCCIIYLTLITVSRFEWKTAGKSGRDQVNNGKIMDLGNRKKTIESNEPKARGLAQHGSPPAWLQESDPAGP